MYPATDTLLFANYKKKTLFLLKNDPNLEVRASESKALNYLVTKTQPEVRELKAVASG